MPSRLMNITLIAAVLTLLGPANSPCAPSTIQPFERSTDGVVLHSSSGTLHVAVCSERIIHIVGSVSDEISKPLVPIVIRACGGAPFTVSSDGTTISIMTSALRVEIDRATDSVRFLTATGQPLLNEQPHGGRAITPVEVDGTPTHEIRQDFLLSPDEALYGLGQHQEGFFNVRDIPIRLVQANTNISIPFLISTNGYGLLWNNAALTDFNPTTEVVPLNENGAGTFQTGREGEYGFLLSGNGRAKLGLTVNDDEVIDLKNMWLPAFAGGKIHLAANTTYKVIAESRGHTELSVRAPSDTMAFRSEAGKAVDYYFIYGPEPGRVIAEYRNFTGAVPLLPLWAYGFWQCRERYSSQQQILDTAAEFRERKIPIDVMVQDWQYWGKYGWNAMRFDEHDYPDPAQMMTQLHHEDLHLVASVWAKFGSETAVDQDMKREHLLLASSDAAREPGETQAKEDWADLFNPKAQALFWSEMNREMFHDGLDGWWLDASEPEGDALKGVMTYLGPGEFVRNAFPLFETSTVYQGQRRTTEQKRVVILSRSAFAGQQRNGTISWSGDISANWETLRRQIPAGLSFAMSGFPYWTTDIGGFFRPADQYTSADYHELLIRWFQFGTFCSIFRIHGYQSKTEMWNYGPEVEKILTQYDELRYRLMPYIYSAAWGVTSRGETIMQALPFVYPHELALRDVDDEFLFGNSLLINPVTQPHATSRSVVLPAGNDWIDFWSGKTYHGGQTIVADSPLDQIPILVKKGSIVPMGPVVQSTADAEDPLEIRIYGGKDADFLLYEDSGDSYTYEHGARATIQLHWDDGRNTLSIGDRAGAFPGMASKQTFHIVLVKEEHGIGIGTESRLDRTATYVVHQMTIVLSKAG